MCSAEAPSVALKKRALILNDRHNLAIFFFLSKRLAKLITNMAALGLLQVGFVFIESLRVSAGIVASWLCVH